jgi:hypothetical protein
MARPKPNLGDSKMEVKKKGIKESVPSLPKGIIMA